MKRLTRNLVLSALSLSLIIGNPTLSFANDYEKLSDDVMPDEVKKVLELMESPNSVGNPVDGYEQQSSGFSTMSTSSSSKAQHKYNSKSFSHAKGGYSVIDVKRSKPGFWRSLYQHKYDGYGYTAYTAKNKYKPSNSSAKVTATKIGPNVNISLRNSDWSLLTSSRTVATDSAKYSSRKYAQANFDDLRIQWLSNLAVSFKVESKLSFSNAGSSTTTTSVLF